MTNMGTRIRSKTGFTLTELIVVLAILVILSAILIPVISGYIQTAKLQVCQVNRNELSPLYMAHLLINDLDHGEITFNTFIADYTVCPGGGMITFEDEKVCCSVNDDKPNSGDIDPGDEVPFLYEFDQLINDEICG